MALATRKAILTGIAPVVQVCKRFRGKINIQRPRAPHFQKALYLAVSKPWFISKYKDKTPVDLCKGPGPVFQKKDVDNPFQRIIAREVLSHFQSSRLVAFYHANPISAEQYFKAFVMFKKQNMLCKRYGKKTMELAVKETPYEAVLSLYVSQNMIVFSPEADIKKLLRLNRKIPQLVLLAGIYEGKFLNKDELIKYSTIPNIQTAQLDLVQTLNSAGTLLVNNLTSHQTTLVANLQERIKQLEE